MQQARTIGTVTEHLLALHVRVHDHFTCNAVLPAGTPRFDFVTPNGGVIACNTSRGSIEQRAAKSISSIDGLIEVYKSEWKNNVLYHKGKTRLVSKTYIDQIAHLKLRKDLMLSASIVPSSKAN